MNKIKVIALFGPAGSGKDYLLHEITNIFTNLHEIVSCTTRPKRQGEKNGINYHFLTEEEFHQYEYNGDMLESVCFNNWWYGTLINSLNENYINIGVFNPEGIRSLLEDSRLEVYPIAITAKAKTRLMRQLLREDNPNIREIFRRYEADEKDFSFIDFDYAIVHNEDSNTSVDDLANIINALI